MRVMVKELQEGCILSADVYSKTNRPIMKKNTVLNNELINILKLFFIHDVHVEKTLINGMPFTPIEVLEDENLTVSKEDSGQEAFRLSDMFLIAVQKYKREFKSWQAGLPIDISRIREIILPLLERAETSTSEIFTLHHFSTKEDYIYQHSVAVAILSAFIAKKLNYNKGEIVQIALAGCLADCGMAKLSNKILFKKTSLTVNEFEEIKKHPTHSYKMVQNISLLRDSTKLGIAQHHERLDGSGYPFGEKGNKIHLFAKIIGTADTFHAMTSERLYRSKQSPFKVLEMMSEDQFGKFDPVILKALMSGIMNFSNGSKVKLSDGQEGEILFMDEKAPTRPLIKLLNSNEIIDLGKHRHLFINEVLTEASR
ncbi:HD-GYP domain-containing protein [Bacillus methanolicus]|uniref:HD-GYP domain-containing protein n=1 Tax=Bacillus methanolicus TaxID=1471 RepID=UPI00238029D9|nr:HD-GYP domain-containing protein [Bacillus methanolicus]